MLAQQNALTLSNFEGPIDFLVHLIHKEELNICDVSLSEITRQFLNKLGEWQEKYLDWGAEFIGTAAYGTPMKNQIIARKFAMATILSFLFLFSILLVSFLRKRTVAKVHVVHQPH